MIFLETIDLVLSGRKTQTLRKAAYTDLPVIGQDQLICRIIQTRAPAAKDRPRWQVGHTYAVQRDRGARAEARILVTSLKEITDPVAQAASFYVAEGFDTLDEFLSVWKKLHGEKSPRCWAIGFELVSAPNRRAGQAVSEPTRAGAAKPTRRARRG